MSFVGKQEGLETLLVVGERCTVDRNLEELRNEVEIELVELQAFEEAWVPLASVSAVKKVWAGSVQRCHESDSTIKFVKPHVKFIQS